jgi:serine phosphatase RsbU (regulator of sigma subunit)
VASHAALFVVLLLVIGFASRQIYNSARAQALDQAKETQSLLAAQTARGIEGFYSAILAGLDLVGDADDEFGPPPAAGDVAPPPAALPADAASPAGPVRKILRDPVGPRGLVFARLVARQLEGRASQVFVLDRTTRLAVPVGEPDAALPCVDVVTQLGDWFATVEDEQISPLRVHNGVGYNVAAVPARKNAKLLIVATIPVRTMEARLLDRLGQDMRTAEDALRGKPAQRMPVATLLADDAGVVMAAQPESSWVGRNLVALGGLAAETMGELRGKSGTKVIPHPYEVGGVQCPASMIASEPVRVAGKEWALLVASDLAHVDAVLTGLVRRGVWWVVFVVISMTALLVSTAIQLIRNRSRFERERTRVLEAELEHARQIQLAWLPDGTRGCERVDVAAVNHPASHISGDFYNWFDLPDGRTAVVIGDVTGHGMAAAFLMATVQLLVRNTLPRTLDPGRCLEDVNRQLCVQMFHGQFVTMQVLVVDCDTGRVEVANAGHPPPLASDGESFQPLKVEPQLVLGIQPDVAYPTERYDLAPGAALLLYTDGVLDAVAVDGKRFEADRLVRSIYGRYENAGALIEDVLASVNQFRGERELVDDLTLVALQLQPSAASTPAEAAMV